MYHRFVKSKVHGTFAQITGGNWEPMVKAMAPRFSYHFFGDSALSGERHTTEAVRRWWQRSFRLMPSATFDILDIVVSGSPRNTSIATAVAVHGTFTVGGDVRTTPRAGEGGLGHRCAPDTASGHGTGRRNADGLRGC
jgi:SnoaL-like domain